MKFKSSLFVGIFFVAISCQKENPIVPKKELILPEISVEGKNTGGLLYNGKVLLLGFPVSDIARDSNKIAFRGSFTIIPNDLTRDTAVTTFFEISNFKGVGLYKNQDIHIGFVQHNVSNRYQAFNSNFVDYVDSHINIIKSDTINKILSGLFEFEFVSTNPMINNGDTVRITKGRFDLKF